MLHLIEISDLIAVAVFAISGALAAAEQELDLLAFILFGTVTGIGGGTARDILLGVEQVFWIADTRYLWVAMIASAATWFIAPLIDSLRRLLLWADAIGLALFSVLGTVKSLEFNVAPVVAVVLGMMTATFGSMLRDTLLNRRAVLLQPEIYVTAAFLGAMGYVSMFSLGVDATLALVLAMSMSFALRAAAIVFDLRLPRYRPR